MIRLVKGKKDNYHGCEPYGNKYKIKKALINCLRGMKRKAHGAQEPRHIHKYVEVTSTAQRSDSPAQAIIQRFLKGVENGYCCL